MKRNGTKPFLAACILGALSLVGCEKSRPTTNTATSQPQAVQALQVPIPTTAAEVPVPPPGAAMTKEYVQTKGRMAYIWGWPLVNAANRGVAFAKAPEPGLLAGVVPVAFNLVAMLTGYMSPDEHFVTCPNQDVVYGIGYSDLDKGPIVFQVPDFGDRFWVYPLYDARTDEFSKIGKAYGTKPGFYLMVGPGWKGEAPAGITGVLRSSTSLITMAPRISMDDTAEDQKAIQPVLSQIDFYPLSQFDGKMKTTDWSKLPHFPAPEPKDKGETKWLKPETFFDQLPAVMKSVPRFRARMLCTGGSAVCWRQPTRIRKSRGHYRDRSTEELNSWFCEVNR